MGDGHLFLQWRIGLGAIGYLEKLSRVIDARNGEMAPARSWLSQ